jgi:hypothetical protein
MAGPLAGLGVTFLYENFVTVHWRYVMAIVLKWTKAITHALRTDHQYLEIRFIPFSATVGLFLPLAHVEFVDVARSRATGISVEDKRIKAYAGAPRDYWSITFTTNIPVTGFESLVEHFRSRDGELYGPTNNCQTQALGAIVSFTDQWSQLTTIVVLGCFISITAVVFGVSAILLFFPLLLVWSLGYNVEMCLRSVAPLLFAAGDAGGMGDILDLFFYLLSPSIDGRAFYEVFSRYSSTPKDWLSHRS